MAREPGHDPWRRTAVTHHDDTDPQPWEVLSSQYLSRKPWLTLRQDRVRLPNGSLIEEYNVLEYPDWVNIVAITTEGRIVLVRQYRHGLRAVHHELPAGVCETTDVDPEQTARRELRDLTHTYLARGVTRVQAPQLEATEDLRVHLASPAEVESLLLSGAITQALHAAPLWQYLRMRQEGPPHP
jgi:ADP-ribose pyrophosphatase